MHGRIMSDGHEPAVPRRAQADSLDGRGAHAYIMEDLAPRQRDFHRPVQATRAIAARMVSEWTLSLDPKPPPT